MTFFLAAILLASIAPLTLAQSAPARILIYSATQEFRHDSIPTAIQALKARGPTINVDFESTEDQSRFTDGVLAGYDALLFLSNTGEVLDGAGQTALQNYLNLGGNFIGVHSATDCLRNTTFYGREIGAFFDYHADLQNATVDVIDSSHPSTSMLPAHWRVQDEMYNFKSDPRTIGATVVLSADESSYVDNGVRKFNQGTPHPTAWFQDYGAGVETGRVAGRSFYTSLGHLNETWQDELFLAHVLGGISWALQANTTRAQNSTALVGNPRSVETGTPSGTPSGTPTGTLAGTSPAASSSGALMVANHFNAAMFTNILLLGVAFLTHT